MNLALLGPEGNFNREIAAAAAERLGFFFLDTDALIRYEHSEHGGPLLTPEFLRREAALCKRLTDFERTVICCGETLPCFEENLRLLRQNAVLVGLTCNRTELYRRRKGTDFYLPHADLNALVRAQKHLPLCDFRLRTDDLRLSPDFSAFAERLLKQLFEHRPDFLGDV